MTTELNTTSVVDEICSQPALSTATLLRLRAVSRNRLAENKALHNRINTLQDEPLAPEEKTLREAAYNWILYQKRPATEAAQSLSGLLSFLIKGGLALDSGNFDDAISHFKAAAEQSGGDPKIEIELAAAFIGGGRLEEAIQILSRLESQGMNDDELFYQQGYCKEKSGAFESACVYYEKALEINPGHAPAAFRLAYYLDLRGKDDQAIEHYKKVTGQGAAFVSAMVNLALLLEDREDMDGAIHYLKEALKIDPTNRRASLYLQDCIGSLDMYYDEAERKENERLEAILRIPCSDFELSVRSRNCLAKMNVRTLGDMVRKTEQELLAYKNFGETSLHEIHHLLDAKGLRLGMFRDEEHKRIRAQRMRTSTVDNPQLSQPINNLELTVRARKCMQILGIDTIGELLERTEAELMAAKNFGQTSLNEIKAKLTEMGLSLKTID